MADLEPYLPYDSDGMRSLARTLLAQARTIGSLGDDLGGAGSSMTFVGPAGDRVRTRLSTAEASAARGAQQLLGAASQLVAAAAQVDAENAAIRRHNDAVLRSLSPLERKLVVENL